MVERRTGPTPVPSLRNCHGRIPDGRPGPFGVPQRAQAAQQPLSRGQLAAGWLVAAIVLALMVAGILGVLR